MVMAKIVNAALKAKAWTFEVKSKATGAKAKAIGPEAKTKTIKIGLEAPRGQGLASRTTSLYLMCIKLHKILHKQFADRDLQRHHI